MKYNKIIMVLAIMLTGCFEKKTDQTKTAIENVVVPAEHDYSEVSDYELTWDSIFDVDSNRYYVYFYSAKCHHCAEIKNFIIERAIERGDVYFVKGTSKDQLTTDTKKLINAEKPSDFYILGYPSLALISNKKCTKNLAGTVQIKTELK